MLPSSIRPEKLYFARERLTLHPIVVGLVGLGWLAVGWLADAPSYRALRTRAKISRNIDGRRQ